MMATLLAIFLLIISVELFSQRLRSRLRSDDVEMSIWGSSPASRAGWRTRC